MALAMAVPPSLSVPDTAPSCSSVALLGTLDPPRAPSTSPSCGYDGRDDSRRACPLPPGRTRLIRGVVRRADARTGRRLAGDRARRLHPDPRAHRQRQDALRVSLVYQPPHVRGATAARRALSRALCLAA